MRTNTSAAPEVMGSANAIAASGLNKLQTLRVRAFDVFSMFISLLQVGAARGRQDVQQKTRSGLTVSTIVGRMVDIVN